MDHPNETGQPSPLPSADGASGGADIPALAELPVDLKEMISAHQASRSRVAALGKTMETIREQAKKLLADSPNAAPILRTLNSASASTTASSKTGTRVTSAKSGSGVQQDGVIRGKVVTPGAKLSPASSSAAAAAEEDNSPGLFSRFFEDVSRDYKEECNVLRTQLIRLLACEEILFDTRQQLNHEVKQKRELQQTIVTLMKQLDGDKETADSEGAPPPETQATPLDEKTTDNSGEALQEALERAKAAEYSAHVLRARLTECETSNKYLREKSSQLEGQLQRILSSGLDSQAAPAASSSSDANTRHPSHPDATSPASSKDQQQGVTKSAYATSELEKQVEELRALLTKSEESLKRRQKQLTALKTSVEKLTSENTELKSSNARYLRELNEKELDLERGVPGRAEDSRLAATEKEVLRVKATMREQSRQAEEKLAKLRSTVQQLELQRDVSSKGITHLSRMLLQQQLRCMVLEQQLQQLERQSSSQPPLPTSSEASDVAAEVCQVDRGDPATTTSAPQIPPADVAADKEEGASAGSTTASANPQQPTPSAALSTAAAGDSVAPERSREQWERRLETAERARVAEVRQLQTLIRELRQALATAQEEVQHKSYLLDVAAATTATSTAVSPRRSPLASGCASPALTPSGSTAVRALYGRDGHEGGYSGDAIDVGSEPPSGALRAPSEVERRYDPEHMPDWQAVQVENEALLARVSALQQEKWALSSSVEDLQQRCRAQVEELRRNAETMKKLLVTGMASPAAAAKGPEEGQLRSLQCMLQETLEQNMRLEQQLAELRSK